MKKLLSFVFMLVVVSGVYAQARDTNEGSTSLIFSIGYVPKSEYQAMKFGVTINDLVFNRFGVYTSFEPGIDTDYFFNTWGVTGRVYENLYLWAGVDLFTKSGGMIDKGFGARKEFGLTYVPHPNIALMPGYSFSVGFSMQVGFRIPLMYVAD